MWWAVGICRKRRSKLNERSIHQKVSTVVVEEAKTSLAKVTPKFVRKTFLEQKETPLALHRWEIKSYLLPTSEKAMKAQPT